MTRSDIVQRLTLEYEALFPGADAFTDATLADLDRLDAAIGEALEDIRDQLEQEGES